MKKTIDWVFVREGCVNVVLVCFFSMLVYSFGHKFITTLAISSLLYLIKEGIGVVLFLIRKTPKDVSFSLYDWSIALAGTWFPLLIRPVSVEDSVIGLCIQVVGVVVTIAGILALNRSFGIVPANRGIKTGGLYQYVRHPLYMGYFISDVGILINNFSAWNCGVVVLCILFQVLRIFQEEKLLGKDAEYQEYMKSTKWRMVPYIF